MKITISGNLIKPKYHSLPVYTIILIIASLLLVDFNLKLYNQEERVICYDVIEYYSYLPATFVYKDISLQFKDNFAGKFWPLTTPNGGKVIRMNMGLSILYSPFFLTTHYLIPKNGFTPNGFTPPYKLALLLSSIFYLSIGLFFLWKILRLYFSPLIISLTFLGITFGTNLFYYASMEAPLSHTYSFCLFGLFIWYTMAWHHSASIKKAVIVGLLFGLISLVRVSNAIIILFFIFWNLHSKQDIKKRLKLYKQHSLKIALMAVCVIAVWIPQLVYWKYITGNWFYYTYGKEHFFFNNPQILNGLFSFRKGWLLYTPLMALPFVSFYWMYKTNRGWFLPITIYIFVQIYVLTSWWTWWYGGSFGQRPMIESYAVLAFPLALFLKKMLSKIKIIRYSTLTLYILLILFSLFETAQYHYGSIHWDSMSRKAYQDSFMHLKPSPNFQSLLSPPDYNAAINGKRNQ
jgi:hypothetical protein